MRINPLFKQFGSKWQSAKYYPRALPELPIFEPYAGSAGYSLNYVDSQITIWDDDVNLRDLWKWLIDEATTSLIMEIPINLPAYTRIDDLGLSRGQALLLKCWQRTNTCGECWTTSVWGSKPGQWTANTRSRVSEEVYAIKHWKFEPIKYDKVGTYFFDPPYEYNFRYGFANDSFDYNRLAKTALTLPEGSLSIVCEARCPKTSKAPTYLPFVDNHSSITMRRKSKKSNELIWTNVT